MRGSPGGGRAAASPPLHPAVADDAAPIPRRYADLLRGRRVALVGPADTLAGAGYAATIDGYDLVVRVNGHWPLPEELRGDLGSRTDIVYHCCNGDARIRESGCAGLRFACHEGGKESPRLADMCRRHGVPCLSYDAFRRALRVRLGTVPNTGVIALAHLLTTQLAELHVAGFSFHETPYHAGYRGRGATAWDWTAGRPARHWEHEFAPQRRYFRSLVDSDPRLTADPFLARLASAW